MTGRTSVAEAAKKHGTRTAPVARRWLHRAAAALTVPPLLVGALAAAPAAAAAGAHTARAAAPAATGDTGPTPAEVRLTEVTPAVPEEDGTVTVSGSVTNRSGAAITGAAVELRSGPRLTTRSSIARIADPSAPSSDGGQVDARTATVALDDIAPGATRSFTMRVPVESLDLGDSGVHQLGVVLTGEIHGTDPGPALGVARTPLSWQPSAAGTRTQVTVLWPLISTPHLTARTQSDEQQSPIFRNDDLADEIAPGGRLQQLVARGGDLPVSWVVDPDLLASVAAMAGAYQVQTPDGPLPGHAQELAKKWLADLEEATRGDEIVALPSGDPDIASLAHRGRNVSGALSHLKPATDVAGTTVKTILNTTPSTDFAWPVDGAVDPTVVAVATSAGARKVITRSDSLREKRGLPYTPTAARPVGGGITAVSADAQLSTLFEGDMTRADTATAAVQQFLAQTQSITEQNPAKQRSIVVAPQRMPTASQAGTMADAVRALTAAGWADVVPLTEAAEAEPEPEANRQVPGEKAYPQELRQEELPTEAFETIRQTQSTLKDFTVILSDEERVVTPFGNAIRREMSTGWRGRPAEAAAYRADVHDYLVGLTEGVRLVEKSRMTLSGRSATIPVTVQNNLVQQVEGLELRLTSGRRIGLDIDDETKPVAVDGGHSQSITFETTAKANGRTFITAQLYTSDGKPYGDPMTFQVDVTEITSTVLLVIAGGVLLVVLAGVRMYTQRKRRGPQADPDAPLTPDEAADAEPRPGPDDRAGTSAADRRSARGDGDRDTPAESRERPGPGEKVDR
ncbi:DUF6049 family protein [Streptomyces sp. TRM 70351]|uniref:DUF6049 family protein n=1 Tax=Streptomyces sp. TRM 70351 TaxID=3116552 RepID=UPI002E7BA000|nr:DUF6049 family protein [Streptomyces sp. TRM 70351]MEE1930007.1 DUF6049 family protein [Streptomyces sp. TRM 70351]